MSNQIIRDSNNKLLGTIRQRPDGKWEARDRNEKVKGIYDPIKNETRNAANQVIGDGNRLSTLF